MARFPDPSGSVCLVLGDFARVTIFLRSSISVALAWMLLTGCAHTRPDGARLSTSEAVRIAKEAAKREGISLNDYKRPVAKYLEHNTWWVFFERHGLFRGVGGFFAVVVDDQTGAARVSHGR